MADDKTRHNVYIRDDIWEQFKKLAEQEKRSKAKYVELLIERELERHNMSPENGGEN